MIYEHTFEYNIQYIASSVTNRFLFVLIASTEANESKVYVFNFRQMGMQAIFVENKIYRQIHVQEEMMFLVNKDKVRVVSFMNLGVSFYEAVSNLLLTHNLKSQGR